MLDFVLTASVDLYLVTGVTLILLVVAQLSFWVGTAFNNYLADKKQLKLNLQILEQKLETAKLDRAVAEGDAGWNGLRTFRVAKLVRESDEIVSVFLTPQDRRPLPFFRPGQYLTFSFDFPNEKKPVVRCYSLSDAPNTEFYRCTIKRVGAFDQTGNPQGKVSTYITQDLQEGDLIQVRAPSGHFHLDLNDDRPVVLLAGGIGVTPIYSMLASIVKFQPHRRVILYYGGKSGQDYALQSEISGLVAKHRNVHVVNCFSAPLASDQLGIDYDVEGWVTPDLLKSTLPANNFHFYLCGPPMFMASLYEGLRNWNVPEKHIHTEAFGPSSVSCSNPRIKDPCDKPACKIKFAKSAIEVDFDNDLESILEAAEQVGVDISYGCRAGNCGSCEIAILKGNAKYLKEAGVEPPAGHALSCVTTPDGDVEIDA